MAKSTHTPKPPHGTPPPNNIPAPTGLTVVRIDESRVQITYNSVPGATTYHIYRDGSIAWIITGTAYIDIYATGQHTYVVAAVVNQVLGNKSNPVTA